THIDHSPAAAPFKAATGAPTYGFGPHVAGRVWAAGGAGESRGGDRDFAPDRAIGDGDVVEGPGWSFEAVHTPGHTHNHLCFKLRETDALFSGDHVMGWSTTVVSPPDGDMRDYMASLDKLLAREDPIYWPTHGPAITDPKRHVTALKAHREARETAIGAALETGLSGIPEIVRHLYTDIPEKLLPAAERTTHSHLVHMIETGRAVSDGAPTADARYGPAGA
ncbi:MAG: MBL fold metallo-hydrolase, partial [Rhodospirillaceae bacterium]